METSNEKSKQNSNCKLTWLSLLSVFSCISVIMLHINSCFWWGDIKENYWVSANIIESLFYFAAPCFFMITGATLIDYRDRYNTKDYFIKRIVKTVIPYFIWSFVGLGILIMANRIDPSEVNFIYIINHLIAGNMIDIYWFFPVLFLMYLVIPLIAFIPKKNRQKILQYVIVVSFVGNSLIPFILRLSGLNITWPYISNLLIGPFTFVSLGYVLKNQKLSFRLEVALYILGFASLLTHLLGTYFLSIKAGELVDIFKGYYTPISILYAISVYLLIKRIGEHIIADSKIEKIINYASGYTFATYLVHYFVILLVDYIYNVAFNIFSTSEIYRLTSIFLVLPIVFVIVFILRLIPIIKYIVPK